MQHITYFILDMVFIGVPGGLFFFANRKKIKKYSKLLFYIFLFSIIIFFIFDPIAIQWGAWVYNPEKVLGIQFEGAAIETLLSSILVCMVIGFFTLLSIEKKGRKK